MAIRISFYGWTMETGLPQNCKLNPDGTIQVDKDRVLFGDDTPTVQDVAAMICLLGAKGNAGAPSWSGGGGGGARGGGSGRSGSQGATGAQGAQGPGVGAQGAQGSDGAQGASGAQGAAGSAGAQGAQGPAGGGSGGQATFHARLSTADGVSNTLTLLPYQGNEIEISGETITVPNVGLSRAIGDNLITALGADSGAPAAASTLYYVYVSNTAASFSPSSIRLSSTAYTTVLGVRYLGPAGNALNWRFVGWVQTNATPQFESTAKNRLIANYYNRRAVNIFTCPQYADDDASQAYTLTSTTWVEIDGTTASDVTFIANGEDEQSWDVACNGNAGNGNQFAIGVGIDDLATSKISIFSPAVTPSFFAAMAGSYNEVAAEGFRTAAILGAVTAGTTTILADDVRRGGAHDPFTTYLNGTVYV